MALPIPNDNQVTSQDQSRCGHAVCTLWVHPPTSSYPALRAEAEPSPKDIAGSDIMKLKVS